MMECGHLVLFDMCRKAVKSVKQYLAQQVRSLPREAEAPFQPGYRQELDVSEELGANTILWDSHEGQTKVSHGSSSLLHSRIFHFLEGGKTVFNHGIISVVLILHTYKIGCGGHLVICFSNNHFKAYIRRCPPQPHYHSSKEGPCR